MAGALALLGSLRPSSPLPGCCLAHPFHCLPHTPPPPQPAFPLHSPSKGRVSWEPRYPSLCLYLFLSLSLFLSVSLCLSISLLQCLYLCISLFLSILLCLTLCPFILPGRLAALASLLHPWHVEWCSGQSGGSMTQIPAPCLGLS